MVGNSLVQVSTCPAVLSSMIAQSRSSSNFLPCLPPKPKAKVTRIRALSADAGHDRPPSSSEGKNPLTAVMDVPRNIWRRTLRPLSDFGFGRRSVWEGGVGLFLVSGTVLLALSLAWLRGFQLRSKFRKYLAVFEFSQACGICTGTPVRIRGVTVGNVIRVNPSLKSIEAVVEVCFNTIILSWMFKSGYLSILIVTYLKRVEKKKNWLFHLVHLFTLNVVFFCRLKMKKQLYHKMLWLK